MNLRITQREISGTLGVRELGSARREEKGNWTARNSNTE